MKRETEVQQSQHKPDKADLEVLGARINELREAKGWSLKDLSELTGLSRSGISRFESGAREPNLELLRMFVMEFPELLDNIVLYLKKGRFTDLKTSEKKKETKKK